MNGLTPRAKFLPRPAITFKSCLGSGCGPRLGSSIKRICRPFLANSCNSRIISRTNLVPLHRRRAVVLTANFSPAIVRVRGWTSEVCWKWLPKMHLGNSRACASSVSNKERAPSKRATARLSPRTIAEDDHQSSHEKRASQCCFGMLISNLPRLST